MGRSRRAEIEEGRDRQTTNNKCTILVVGVFISDDFDVGTYRNKSTKAHSLPQLRDGGKICLLYYCSSTV